MSLLAEAQAVFSENVWVTITVALVAALPGLFGIWYSWRKSRREDDVAEDQVGLGFAKTAFINMEKEVARLSKQVSEFDTEKAVWDHDRRVWAEDKGRLLRKIAELTEQLNLTNGYLQILLVVVENHGLAAPNPPNGLTLRGKKDT